MPQKPIPPVQGRSLLPLLARDQPFREAALYGVFGSGTNLTDGRYTYFRYPPDLQAQEIYQYTLMATQMRSRFPLEPLREATLAPPFDFTKGVPTVKIPSEPKRHPRAAEFIGGGMIGKPMALDALTGEQARALGIVLEHLVQNTEQKGPSYDTLPRGSV
jgi:hypothetical protein